MKTIYCKFFLPALFLVCSFRGVSQTQTAESWTLNSAETGTKDYVARDYIILNPGFSFSASAGNIFSARIDKSLTFPLTDGLYMLPDGTFTNDPKQGAAVGSIPGAFDVSPTGAAIYSLPIETPQGIQGMQPNVSLVYNSQAGNGIAGWGCNLSGLSVITRAPKNIYHDGTAKGMTFLADDSYYLDGKRLIYSSGTAGQEEAVYYPESDPFTKIIVHGTYNTTTANTWFEVQASNGMKYYYGSTASGRQSYTAAGSPRILAWYLDYVEDPSRNYISYSYYNWNNYLYPDVIWYDNFLYSRTNEKAIEKYLEIVNAYLDERNGEGWRQRMDAELEPYIGRLVVEH